MALDNYMSDSGSIGSSLKEHIKEQVMRDGEFAYCYIIEQSKEIKELKEQIEKMKNCMNCKNVDFFINRTSLLIFEKCKSCKFMNGNKDLWELIDEKK